MRTIAKSIRIEPAFDDPKVVRAMFERHAPYRTMAGYLPIASMEETSLPWFRGNWAANGEPLVAGAEKILHNQRFIDAARAFFGGSTVRPTFIVVNVNAPMPAGPTHVDIPTFRGATRDQYPLPFLVAMGQSGLFESWRVVQAGALTWFYDGPGGNFEYWSEGLNGPRFTERSPFGATYPSSAIRLSLLWKGIRESEAHSELLTLDRVMSIFTADLRRRSIDFRIPADPLSDSEWMALLDRSYYVRPGSENATESNEGPAE